MGLRLLIVLLHLSWTFALAAATNEWSTQTPTSTLESAEITLVGAAARDSELRGLLTELLGRLGVRAVISVQPAFGNDQLLSGPVHDGVVQVFVVPAPEDKVGLYFRAPDGQHFLLRNLWLPAGLDAVGREQIAQIVETAVASLRQSSAGLSREEAATLLAPSVPTASAARHPPQADEAHGHPINVAATIPPKATRASGLRRARPQHDPTLLEGWLALGYRTAWLGSALKLAHGPELEIGLGFERAWIMRGRAMSGTDFSQSASTSRINATFSTWHFRFSADAGVNLDRGQALLLSAGIGQDRTEVKPQLAPGSSVAPVRNFQNAAPIAHTELRYEVGNPTVRLAVAVGADVSLVRTHYDVVHDRLQEQVVRPWMVRPTLGLLLGFTPRWGTF